MLLPTTGRQTVTIKLAPGQPVWFHKDAQDPIEAGGAQPLAAIVTYVWSDRMVNLVVFDANGHSHSRTSMVLLQEGDTLPVGGYCTLVPSR
jgi:hypothetical protein